jgi:primosomal replication protein N
MHEAGPSTARIISPSGPVINIRTRVASGASVTVIGFIAIVFLSDSVTQLHRGAWRIAVRDDAR